MSGRIPVGELAEQCGKFQEFGRICSEFCVSARVAV